MSLGLKIPKIGVGSKQILLAVGAARRCLITREVPRIESVFILAVAIWLIRIGRDLQRLAKDNCVTTYRIGRN